MTQPKRSINWRKITESKLFFPVLALSIILFLDLIFVPNFFSFQVRNGNVYGSLIDIMRNAIALNGSFFTAQRMLQEYLIKAYSQ